MPRVLHEVFRRATDGGWFCPNGTFDEDHYYYRADNTIWTPCIRNDGDGDADCSWSWDENLRPFQDLTGVRCPACLEGLETRPRIYA